jgi:AcrR family transcriptional regulator
MTTVSRTRPRDRRGQLALIAADLFGRHGYHNVSVNDIAAAAGISGPAIYRHFPSKQAILGHLMLTGLEQCVQVVEERLGGGDEGEPQARVRGALEALARLVVQRPELGALWRRERRHLAPGDLAAMMELAGRPSGLIVGELLRMRPELGADDAALLAWAATSVFGSVSDHRVRLPKARFEQLLADIAGDVLWAWQPAAAGEPPLRSPNGELPLLDTRREQLVALAAQMFCDRGYHAVTMEEIGAAAGIAGPSIYNHFSGKSDLLQAICSRIGDRLRLGVGQAFGTAASPGQTLTSLATSYVDTVLEFRELVAAYFSEGHNLPDRDRAESRRFQAAYTMQWADLLRAISPGLAEKEARIRVHAAFAVVNDLAQTKRFAERPRLDAELRELMLTVLGVGRADG